MSLAPYIFRPLTPPEADHAAVQQHKQHNRSISASYIANPSPESMRSTPDRAVYRQHGPTLLPKIRTQDNTLHQSAGQAVKSHKRSVSSISNVSNYNNVRPPMYRCATEPVHDNISLVSPVSMIAHSRATSVAPFISQAPRVHSRAVSSCSIDEATLSSYAYPTYRQPARYPTEPPRQPSPPAYSQPYMPSQQLSFMDAPTINIDETWDLSVDLESFSRPTSSSPEPFLMPSLMSGSIMNEPETFTAQSAPMIAGTTSLMNYLSQPTQPINLVRNLTYSTARGLSSYFWWDVRNIRPWHSFSLDRMSSIPDLMTLLHFQHDNNSFSTLASQSMSAANPSSEGDLASLISKVYFPRVNAAAQLSLGQNAPYFYIAPAQPATPSNGAASMTQAQPTFLANYPNENQFTLQGSPRGRVVGLAKSFDTFNTAMRNESPAQRVRYLKTLSQLQKCMRDHSCRYGFIITEIELVCVRAGSDKYGNPYFGYLEVADSIATKTSAKYGIDASGNYTEEIDMTAGLALYFLLMLAKKVALPGEWASFMDVGGLGAMTRQRVLPSNDEMRNDAFCNEDGDVKDDEERKADGRDKWMPEPQVGEKRDAKTARGWVMPSDPWHKREGGRRSRRG